MIDDLTRCGPLLPVRLWVPRDVTTDVPPIDVMAEVNTGSLFTFIQEGIGTSLGLMPIDDIQIMNITSRMHTCYMYRLRVVLPNAAFEANVIEVPYLAYAESRIQCRLGRDILQYGILTYNGRASTFSFDLTRNRER
jgi:hypothetical protein